MRVPLPLTLALDTGVAFDVILPAGECELTCSGELVGLNMGKGSASLRLRFRVLTPEKRRALRRRGITPRIARRGIESSERLGRYRWVVEITQS